MVSIAETFSRAWYQSLSQSGIDGTKPTALSSLFTATHSFSNILWTWEANGLFTRCMMEAEHLTTSPSLLKVMSRYWLMKRGYVSSMRRWDRTSWASISCRWTYQTREPAIPIFLPFSIIEEVEDSPSKGNQHSFYDKIFLGLQCRPWKWTQYMQKAPLEILQWQEGLNLRRHGICCYDHLFSHDDAHVDFCWDIHMKWRRYRASLTAL